MSNELCGTCRYWTLEGTPDSKTGDEIKKWGDHSGLCTRYPPVLDQSHITRGDDLATESPTAWVQPRTWSEDGCGEHKPK